MSLASYPEYKDSGVPWVGDVPAHWETWKMSHAFARIGSGTTPPSSEPEWYEDGVIPWVTTGELRENRIADTANRVTDAALAQFSALKVHPKGALVIAMYGATIGRLGILDVDATMNQACCAISGSLTHVAEFVSYWFNAFKEPIIENFAVGGGQPNISLQVISNLLIPSPPLVEQRAIAGWLDKKTGEIDLAVAAQRMLLGQLKEKRRALIAYVVTRGLDPAAPLKDSGISWLGQVPAHWEVTPMGHLIRIASGATPDKSNEAYWAGIIPWVSPKDMKVEFIGDAEDHVSEEAVVSSALRILPVGSILIVVRGMILAHSFPVAVTTAPLTINQDMKALLCIDPLTTEFLRWSLIGRTDIIISLADASAHGTKKIGSEILTKLPIPVPPLAEQQAIAAHLDRETQKLDDLAAESERTITLLQEHRTALIAAAVTGKLCVTCE